MNPHSLAPLTDNAAWHGSNILDDPRWQLTLTTDDIADLDNALSQYKRDQKDWSQITGDNLSPGSLAARLSGVADELENGLGMVQLKGLPVHRYDSDDLRILWMHICVHLGTPLFQNARGELMGVISDDGPDVGTVRGQMIDKQSGQAFLSSRSRAQSSAALRWHTDRCDVVGLLCASQAKSGGHSRLCSSVTVHNLMLQRHPELAAVLYADLPRSHLGEEKGGEDCFYPLPVFSTHQGKFSSHYSRTFVEACDKHEDMPPITDAQWQALDLLTEIATECSFEMKLQAGDIQLLNNHVMYHARDAFADGARIDEKRKLYRIWLSMPNSRALAPGLKVLWGNTEAGAIRGGMCQSPLPGTGVQPVFSEPRERTPFC